MLPYLAKLKGKNYTLLKGSLLLIVIIAEEWNKTDEWFFNSEKRKYKIRN